MRVTVDIDEDSLEKLKRLTGMQETSAAIGYAVEAWLHLKEKKAFLASVMNGETDYAMKNDAIERRLYGTD